VSARTTPRSAKRGQVFMALGWVTWQYFCSLAGIDHFKPDVMLMRFAAEALGRYVSPAATDALLSRAFENSGPPTPG
jgi:hypothetical protein